MNWIQDMNRCTGPIAPDIKLIPCSGDIMNDVEVKTCTIARPYKEGDSGRWRHPNAVEIGEEYYGLAGGGDYVIYRCPYCNLKFRVELPD